MVINPIVGVYIPIIRIPIKGGMTIPNIATFDHGTYGKKLHGQRKAMISIDFLGFDFHLSIFFVADKTHKRDTRSLQQKSYEQNNQIYPKVS